MASSASRDYKVRRQPRMDTRRLRDLAVGAAAGIALTTVVFLYVGAHRASNPAVSARPVEQHPAPGAAPRGVAAGAQGVTFDVALPHPEVQMPRQQKQIEDAVAARAGRR